MKVKEYHNWLHRMPNECRDALKKMMLCRLLKLLMY